jgi:hypothetical protein
MRGIGRQIIRPKVKVDDPFVTAVRRMLGRGLRTRFAATGQQAKGNQSNGEAWSAHDSSLMQRYCWSIGLYIAQFVIARICGIGIDAAERGRRPADIRRAARPVQVFVGEADEFLDAEKLRSEFPSQHRDVPIFILPGLGHSEMVNRPDAIRTVGL